MLYPTHHYGTTMSSGAPATPELLQRLVELEHQVERLVRLVGEQAALITRIACQDAGTRQKGGHEK